MRCHVSHGAAQRLVTLLMWNTLKRLVMVESLMTPLLTTAEEAEMALDLQQTHQVVQFCQGCCYLI